MSVVAENLSDQNSDYDLEQVYKAGCLPAGTTLALRDIVADDSRTIRTNSYPYRDEAICAGLRADGAMCLDVEQRALRLSLGIDSISVLIAAYNEKESLENVVRDIQTASIWRVSATKEIVICLNGCTDDSPEIAGKLSHLHPEIKVISTPVKSKNAAWELLVKESCPSSDVLFFVDADVGIDRGALLELDNVLQARPDISLVGAFPRPFNRIENGLDSYQKGALSTHADPGVQARRASLYQGLCGGCYAIRRERAVDVTMPSDPRIADDQYLQFSLRDEFMMAPKAQFYFGVASFIDYVRQHARQRVARKILREEYPDVYAERAEAIAAQPARNFSQTAFAQGSPAVKLHIFLGRVASLLGTALSEYYLRTGTDPWTKIESTKGWSLAPDEE
jgi:hypothetical protein